MTWYQKTVCDPDAGNSSGASGGSMHMLHDDGMAGMNGSMSDRDKQLMMMKMREFNHVSVLGGTHYDYSNKIRANFDGKVTRLSYMDGDAMWSSRLTVIDVGYSSGGFMNMGFASMPMGLTLNGAFALVKMDESPAPPTVPQLIAGIAYGGM